MQAAELMIGFPLLHHKLQQPHHQILGDDVFIWANFFQTPHFLQWLGRLTFATAIMENGSDARKRPNPFTFKDSRCVSLYQAKQHLPGSSYLTIRNVIMTLQPYFNFL